MLNFATKKDVAGKTVLLRLDLNEDLDNKTGLLLDDFRLEAVLPTINWLQENKAKIIIASHRGRPEGEFDQKFSLQKIANALARKLNAKFVDSATQLPKYHARHLIFWRAEISAPETLAAAQELIAKDILFLENLRFYEGEEQNEKKFCKILASLAQVYINDAFAVSHREAASITGIANYLPSFAGPLIKKETKNLDLVLTKARSPFILMMGGIKISDKAKTLENLGSKADKILLGGGLANLFLSAKGFEVGASKIETQSKALALQIAKNFSNKIMLPLDVAVKTADGGIKSVDIQNVNSSDSIYDIGPKTILEFSRILKTAKTIVWNGPLGYFEEKSFRAGSFSLAKVAASQGQGASFVLVGGGETVAVVRRSGQQQYIDHVSTGGGAMLEYLSGNVLPGLKVLEKKRF